MKIPVYYRRQIHTYAEIDDDMYEKVIKYSWTVAEKPNGKIYPISSEYIKLDTGEIRKKTIRMHQVILKVPEGSKLQIDHIDRNPLNNKIENLRLVTHSQNARNHSKYLMETTSKYIGVCWHIRLKKWQAAIRIENEQKCIGYYKTEEEAAKARDYYARRVHKEYASLNFPDIDELPETDKFEPITKRKYITPHIDNRNKNNIKYKFRIQITIHGKHVAGNTRLTLEEAVKWRDKKLVELGIPIPD